MSDHREKLEQRLPLIEESTRCKEASLESRQEWADFAAAIREMLKENEEALKALEPAFATNDRLAERAEKAEDRIEAALAHCKRIREFLPDTNYSVEEVLDIIAEALQGKKP